MAIDTISTEAGIEPQRPLRATFHRVWLACRAWCVKRRTRRSLLELTDEQLRDIGISRSEAQREIRKSFYWD